MSGPRIAVVDYGMGNRRSVEKALVHVGARVRVTGDVDALGEADGLVLPGVGAFPRGIARLRAAGLDRVIGERVAAGVPLLGICLGMQLLFDHSDEGDGAWGLGLLPGEVTALDAGGARLPHIGWNEVSVTRPSVLLEDPGAFYHVHSYCARPADPDCVLATAEYGERFVTAVGRGRVFGVQFHPEKSSRTGLALLSRFTTLAARSAAAAASGRVAA